MCGIPDFRVAYKDSDVQFAIEFSNPQPATCQSQRRQVDRQPANQMLDPTPELMRLALPLIAQMFQE